MRYGQRSGRLEDARGGLIATGYSGAGEGRNNPDMQDVHNVGPIVRGWYTRSARLECSRSLAESEACPDCAGLGKHRHGPDVIRWIPDAANDMRGRGGFLAHGDNAAHAASEGCTIFDHATRMKIHADPDDRLEVVEE